MLSSRRWKGLSQPCIAQFSRPQCPGRTWATRPGSIASRQSADSVSLKHSKWNPRTSQPVAAINSLAQGMVSVERPTNLDDISEGYPTVIQQARNNMRKFDNCVVLTRVGNFYELYCEQAEQYGVLLGLKVASKKTNVGAVAMAGFPFFQLDRFLKTLVQDYGKHVAISEEVPNDPSQKVKSGGLLFDRQVLRVITPGTLIDEQFLNPFENNYLLAISFQEDSITSADPSIKGESRQQLNVGLSWLDLSSGDFFTQSISADSLASALARIGPREIVLRKGTQDTQNHEPLHLPTDGSYVITHLETPDEDAPMAYWRKMFDDDVTFSFIQSLSNEEKIAGGILLQYVSRQIPHLQLRLQAPIKHSSSEHMTIEKNSLRGLEILRTLRDGNSKGSLLHSVRRTSTESGARLLAHRLTSPSMSPKIINQRLDLVDLFCTDRILHEDIVALLRKSYDTRRLVQKFSFGRGDADDLIGLARTIQVMQDIAALVTKDSHKGGKPLKWVSERFSLDGPKRVAADVLLAIDEEGLSLRQRDRDSETAEAAKFTREVLDTHDTESEDLNDLQRLVMSKSSNKNTENLQDRINPDDIWIMRRGASTTLDRLHDMLLTLQREKIQLSEELKERLSVSTLTLKVTPGLGHICHVKGKDVKADLSILDNARTVGSSKSTRSFYLPQWTRLGARIEDVKMRIRAEEHNIFTSLRGSVIKNLIPLRRNAALLDELDVACSFAQLALEYNLKRPVINHSCECKIIAGRHMTVDVGLSESGRLFTPNDLFLNDKERIWLITGPNMAGKSTFLRQTAIISILAQTGSFVPAEYAEIGLVDQIFSRVGSADNLFLDQSTFMVEMLETAHILKNATERSLALIDEVGRGTSYESGLSIAYAVINHLQSVNRCRVLFATHFHALVDMTKRLDSIACYCSDVIEESDGSFTFVHKLQRGVNRNTHSLKVAKLAGMPLKVLKMAGEVLLRLEKK